MLTNRVDLDVVFNFLLRFTGVFTHEARVGLWVYHVAVVNIFFAVVFWTRWKKHPLVAFTTPLTDPRTSAEEELGDRWSDLVHFEEYLQFSRLTQLPHLHQVIFVWVDFVTHVEDHDANVDDGSNELCSCWARHVDWENFSQIGIGWLWHKSGVSSACLQIPTEPSEEVGGLCEVRGAMCKEVTLCWFWDLDVVEVKSFIGSFHKFHGFVSIVINRAPKDILFPLIDESIELVDHNWSLLLGLLLLLVQHVSSRHLNLLLLIGDRGFLFADFVRAKSFHLAD